MHTMPRVPAPRRAACASAIARHCGSRRRPVPALLLLGLLCAAPAPPEPAPAKVEQVRKAHAEPLLGQSVTDGKGDVVGTIVDVLIDPSGTPQAAVLEFSGFFGLGNRRVAVDWKALDFSVDQDRIVIRLHLDADKIKAMPEYKPEAASVPVATPTAAAAKPH
jgi:hypothetical protein